MRHFRAVKLQMSDDYSLSSRDMANLAIVGGFDHVTLSGSAVYACVKATSGSVSQLTQYPKINMHAVDPPTDKVTEYLITPYADYALAYPEIIDGNNEDLQISDCYKISHFKARNFRYLRLDPTLLECLDMASDYYGTCIDVVADSGYRPHSLNNQNIESRHEEEKWRFNVGMAAEIKPRQNTVDEMENVALTIMRSCTPSLRLKRMKLGMGTHGDRIYIDIRQSNGSNDIFELWDVDNGELHQKVNEAYEQLLKGKYSFKLQTMFQ